MPTALIVATALLVLAIPPTPTSRVNDYVGLLTAVGQEQLEKTLYDGERQTGTQMVVAIFDSLKGEDLEDYSTRLANAWGIGRRGFNDGVTLVIFLKERKMRLAVGDGLRKAIPDTAASDIVATIITPRFRSGQHLLGLQEAARAIFERVQATR